MKITTLSYLKPNKGYLFIYLFMGLIYSCKDDLSPEQTTNNISQEQSKVDFNKFGKKLENPYSVTNMKKALNNIQAQKKTSKLSNLSDSEIIETGDFEIETSHYYVKFTPKTAQEEANLKKDSTLILANYPLDYEFSDAEFSAMTSQTQSNENFIPEYFVAVPVDKKLPENVPVQKLEDLYIPEQDSYFDDETENNVTSRSIKKPRNPIKDKLLDALLDEAFKITGNDEEEQEKPAVNTPSTHWWIFGKKWRPSGRITMWDNTLNREVPVEGAQILMRQWFTVDSGITDGNGYFSTGTVRGQARYVIQWERHHYDIRSGWFGQAETRGPEMKNQGWYVQINDPLNTQYAMIHRAAHHYYYKDINGLRRPPFNNEIPSRIKIAAIDSYNSSINGDFSFWRGLGGILPSLRIYKRDKSSDYYGTTIHELAHAAHWKANWITFQNIDDIVAESWARGVQWDLTRMIYPNYNIEYSRLDYTGVVQDLIDGEKRTISEWHSKYGVRAYKFYDDKIKNYTIKQIELSLNGIKNWNSWQNNFKSIYNNESKNNIDETFNYWNSK